MGKKRKRSLPNLADPTPEPWSQRPSQLWSNQWHPQCEPTQFQNNSACRPYLPLTPSPIFDMYRSDAWSQFVWYGNPIPSDYRRNVPVASQTKAPVGLTSKCPKSVSNRDNRTAVSVNSNTTWSSSNGTASTRNTVAEKVLKKTFPLQTVEVNRTNSLNRGNHTAVFVNSNTTRSSSNGTASARNTVAEKVSKEASPLQTVEVNHTNSLNKGNVIAVSVNSNTTRSSSNGTASTRNTVAEKVSKEASPLQTVEVNRTNSLNWGNLIAVSVNSNTTRSSSNGTASTRNTVAEKVSKKTFPLQTVEVNRTNSLNRGNLVAVSVNSNATRSSSNGIASFVDCGDESSNAGVKMVSKNPSPLQTVAKNRTNRGNLAAVSFNSNTTLYFSNGTASTSNAGVRVSKAPSPLKTMAINHTNSTNLFNRTVSVNSNTSRHSSNRTASTSKDPLPLRTVAMNENGNLLIQVGSNDTSDDDVHYLYSVIPNDEKLVELVDLSKDSQIFEQTKGLLAPESKNSCITVSSNSAASNLTSLKDFTCDNPFNKEKSETQNIPREHGTFDVHCFGCSKSLKELQNKCDLYISRCGHLFCVMCVQQLNMKCIKCRQTTASLRKIVL